jgi:NADH-quinone oxidoreductase subunit G
MEGYKGLPPAPLIPFFWSPGWNSVQSVAKYQVEPGGALRGGDPGVLLFKDKTGVVPTYFKDIPLAFVPRQQKWLLLPQYHVLGSGELSSYSKALQQLSPQPFAALAPMDAARMGLSNGDIFRFVIDETEQAFPVKILEHLQSGLLVVSAGLDGLPAMSWGAWARVETGTLKPSELRH